MPALPYSKKRYYLSGIDWIIGALNSYMLHSTPAGNHSTLILELDSSLNPQKLKKRLDTLLEAIPILSGKIVRDKLNLAPYWKAGKQSPSVTKYDFRQLNSDNADDIDKLFSSVLNSPFSSENVYISFTLISCELRNILLMTFDHRILDARGAELFLELLSDSGGEKDSFPSIDEIKTTDSPHLKSWSEKFAAGRTVQRRLISLSKEGCFSPSKFNMKNLPRQGTGHLMPLFSSFSEEETLKISGDTEKKAGFMMETPYLLAVTALAVYQSGKNESTKYFVPVPIDMRNKGEEKKRMLYNHLSFLFFYFEISPETTLEELICEIRRQLFRQIAENFPEDMINAAYPGRIFPFRFLRWAMSLPFNAKNCSFVFANVGKSSFTSGKIMNAAVQNIQHMPRIPTPPGIGIFFNRYNSRMNLTVISDKDSLHDSNLGEKIRKNIKSLLINQ